MYSEKDALLSLGESAPSSPNVPLVQPLDQEVSMMTSTPLVVPNIEIEAGTPDRISPTSSRRPDGDHRYEASRLESRLNHSGSRHSLSKVMTQQQRKKEQRRQRSAQLPAHGEVQKMEQSLLKLLKEFNSGELRGFDSAYSLDQMESVRDQQEALARKHFELGAQQDLHPLLSDDGLQVASQNMAQLINSLEKLSVAIGQLSCLDRMVDPEIRLDQVDINARRERGILVRGDTDRSSREESLQFSRRSTMSTENSSNLENNLLTDDDLLLVVPKIVEETVQDVAFFKEDVP